VRRTEKTCNEHPSTCGAWQLCRVEADTAGRAFTGETVVRLLATAQEVNRVLDPATP